MRISYFRIWLHRHAVAGLWLWLVSPLMWNLGPVIGWYAFKKSVQRSGGDGRPTCPMYLVHIDRMTYIIWCIIYIVCSVKGTFDGVYTRSEGSAFCSATNRYVPVRLPHSKSFSRCLTQHTTSLHWLTRMIIRFISNVKHESNEIIWNPFFVSVLNIALTSRECQPKG